MRQRGYAYFDPIAGKFRTFSTVDAAIAAAEKLQDEVLKIHGLRLHFRFWQRSEGKVRYAAGMLSGYHAKKDYWVPFFPHREPGRPG